jgi:hypothetical protein
MKTEHDIFKGMFKTLRTLTENKITKKSLNEEIDFPSHNEREDNQNQQNLNDDVTVINDVDVKMLSSDKADMVLTDEQKSAISQIIDSFREQVSQIVEFDPGMTINQNQIRLDGTLTDEDVSFVFIAGEESGVYINADMLKLEQNVATVLEKLVKFELTYKTALEPLITQRDNN